ncbi:MAG: DUF2497 domain-containing protein [Rhodospirillales bacterium]|nr:DUF2497 domain-containing protein [Rhodospirillales bacterium]
MSATAKAEPAASGDPSMEDILASIRRILSEDEAAPEPAHAAAQGGAADDVLVLDESMIRAEPPLAHSEPPAPPIRPVLAPAALPPEEPGDLAQSISGLVAPETAEAAASSVGGLLRAIASDRALQVRSAGPSIEDLVRQALRPLLKEWLDAHLPGLVERLVRAEIERVVGRAMN